MPLHGGYYRRCREEFKGHMPESRQTSAQVRKQTSQVHSANLRRQGSPRVFVAAGLKDNISFGLIAVDV
jgi:hypothetical protein